MSALPGTQPRLEAPPLSAQERARGEAKFVPYIADVLDARDGSGCAPNTPERVELFQRVARKVSDKLGRPVLSYANGREIVIAFGPEAAPGLTGGGAVMVYPASAQGQS